MSNEDWKELMKTKGLEAQLHWLLAAQESYLRESDYKWKALMHASLVSDNFREAVDYNNREGDAQKERYEWLLEYISENYIRKEEQTLPDGTEII